MANARYDVSIKVYKDSLRDILPRGAYRKVPDELIMQVVLSGKRQHTRNWVSCNGIFTQDGKPLRVGFCRNHKEIYMKEY